MEIKRHEVHPSLPKEGEIRDFDGHKHKWTRSKYTIREYYSHFTPGKGPGPGWDFKTKLLNEDYVLSHFGRTFSDEEVFDPTKLPDEPFYQWEPVEE